MGSSPPPTHINSTSKCGAILLKTNWEAGINTHIQPRLQERSTWNWVGREEKQSGYDQHPWEGTQKRKGIAGKSSMGSEQCTPHIGCPGPRV